MRWLTSIFFSLNGLKDAFAVLENEFRNISFTDNIPSVTLTFSSSPLLDQYRKTNDLLTIHRREGNNRDLAFVLNTLVNNAPPDNDTLEVEGTGVGLVTVFLSKTRTEFQALCKHPGDELVLDALETNLHRVACDFFYADFVCKYLDNHGNLNAENKLRLQVATRNLVTQKRAIIPNNILAPLFRFMRYTLIGTFSLNQYSAGRQQVLSDIPDDQTPSLKRKRILNKLSKGYTINKKRRFAYSRLKEALGNTLSKRFMEEQIEILEANVVITRPTRRSVELSRRLCATAQNY